MANGQYIGIDLGTTGIKAGLFDESGRAVATASREMPLETPAPGFAEFDAGEYLSRALDAIRETLGSPGAEPGAVRAIGLSSQAQTFVLLDSEGCLVHRAVSWLDVRAEAEAGELSAVAQRTGWPDVNAIASAPKILWLRRHEPGPTARASRVLVIPDYLIWRLTGRAATDPVTAGSTGLYDAWERRWSAPLLDACGLTEAMMPDVLGPGEAAGRLSREAARALGLRESTIVVVGTNDQYTGALGAGNVEPGCASMALGTALAVVATSASRDGAPHGVAVQPHPAARPGSPLYAVLGYAKTSGVVIRWLRERLAPTLSYDDLFREAASVPVGAEGVTCIPHFSGTATPDFNPAVRGAFAGLGLSHGRAHLMRALAESLAFTVRDNLGAIGAVVRVTELRAIGGGAKSDVWLQMIADATGVPVARPETSEAACLGAAALAMVGAGRFASVAEAASRLYRPSRRFAPDPASEPDYAAAYLRQRAMFESLYGRRAE